MKAKSEIKTPEEMAKFLANLSFEEVVIRLIAESPVQGQTTKLLLAESVAALRFELRLLMDKQKANDIRGDEVRAIPAVTSNMRRILERLGTTNPVEEDFSF